MTKQPSAFSKKNIIGVTINPEAKPGLLEELNLPPGVVAFVRNNKKQLQIAGIVLAVAVLAWAVYDYYVDQQDERAVAELTVALQFTGDENRIPALTRVAEQYPRTSSALWSRVELANIDFKAGNLDRAIAGYQAVLADLDKDNPLYPLVELSIAQSLETKGDLEQALAAYRALSEMEGFKGQGFKGMGRINELRGNLGAAKKSYEQYLTARLPLSPEETSLITGKLARIKERIAATPEGK
ncbi:MAG: tetratricopeptide repeat protein [Desulfobacterales bacterium]|nr:tetratricopeptide repeat protein [Desulfobacterales bacterium]